MKKTRLNDFNNDWYYPGNKIKIFLWYLINRLFFLSSLPYPNSFKIILLRSFGCKISFGVVLKPRISIKYPWMLSVGDNSWIGENVIIDNLAQVDIGKNVCVSQGAYLLTGSHDYKDAAFGLIVKSIKLQDGCWVGCRAIVCPGIILGYEAVLTAGSVAVGNIPPNQVFQGNPAIFKRMRHS